MAITIDGDSGVSGVNGSATTPALQGTDSNTGIVFGTDTVQVATGGSTRATVDSSGRLGIGTSSPAAKLQVNVGTNQNFTATSTGGLTQIQAINDAGNAFVPLDIAGSYIALSPSSTERARVTSDGLTFNGDTAAANALDDYEEGDWTPTILGTSITYTTRNGHYVKIGKVVWIQCEVNISGGTVQSSFSILTGLPFTSRTVEYPKMTIATNGGNWNGGAVPVAQVQPNATSLAAIGITNNSGFNNINATHLWDATGNWVAIAGIYEVP